MRLVLNVEVPPHEVADEMVEQLVKTMAAETLVTVVLYQGIEFDMVLLDVEQVGVGSVTP